MPRGLVGLPLKSIPEIQTPWTVAQVAQLAALRVAMRRKAQSAKISSWQPLSHQVPPSGDDWDIWIMRAGRGAGKTRGAAEDTLAFIRANPGIRMGIGAPTLGDARAVCAEGESGLITIAREEFNFNRSLLEARHRNGAYVRFMGAEDPDRWRGPQWHRLWLDELGSWPKASFEQAIFGNRLGTHPRLVISMTPRPIKWIQELEALPTTVVTRATTRDNPYISEIFKRRILERYEGTHLGRQEINAEYVDDIEGALWLRSWIDDNRRLVAPQLSRIVVPIDPAVTSEKGSDETGIAVVGLGNDGEYYVLHGEGYRLSPDGWANRAVDLFDQFQADRVLGEVNNGGDMVESTIRSVRRTIPFKSIHASRGKAVRAEPVAALYQQGKVHHVGIFASLEDQMCTFPVANEHDDLVDALVYGVTELMAKKQPNVRYLE